MVINGYSLIIGIVIGLVILFITIFASSDRNRINLDPIRVKIEPKEVNLPENQSSNDIDSIKAEISKLWDVLSSLDQKSEKFFDNYSDRLVNIEQRIGTDLENDDPRRHLRVNGFNRPVVYVVYYIYADAYGSYDEVDVFANEEDAIEFVQKLKDSNLGVSDVSINPRMVYLDKDKTLDNVDNL